jgi:chemotaxis protein methyltransferase CheR
MPASAVSVASAAAVRDGFLELVESGYGLRLSAPQVATLDERVRQLLAETDCATPEQLLEAFRSGRHGNVLERLAAGLTIGETHFFRVAPQIEALRRHVLPEVIGRKATAKRLALWSAGCSTGEEVYTLAILLREQLPAAETWDLRLLGTDVSPAALAVARAGLYGEWSFRDTPEEVRTRYFTPATGPATGATGASPFKGGAGAVSASRIQRWQIAETLRRMARFERLNLVADALPGEAAESNSAGSAGSAANGTFDLVLCRNVTIYFSAETTQRLYRRLAACLASGGWLVLGPSDPPPDALTQELLAPVYFPGAVLWRRRDVQERRPVQPQGTVHHLPETTHRQASRPARPRFLLPSGDPAPPPNALRSSSASARLLGQAEGQGEVRQGGGASRPTTAETSPPADTPDTWALVASGDKDGALRAAHALVKTQPAAAGGHLVLGLLALETGDPAALDALRRATFLEPEDALAQFALGRAYAQQGQPGRARTALAHARRLLAGVPDDECLPGGVAAGALRRSVEAALAGIDQ